jgi:hypothetical protein
MNQQFFIDIKPGIDIALQVTPKQLEIYTLEVAASAVFNFKPPLVDNRHSLTTTPDRDHKIMESKASHNVNYSSTTEFHVPSVNTALDPLVAGIANKHHLPPPYTLADKEPVGVFNTQHPLRHSIPHKGPGVANMKSITDESSYVRVAGLISQLSYDLLDMNLPKWIPVLIDIAYMIVHADTLTLNLPNEEAILKKKWHVFLMTTVGIIDMVEATNLSQHKKFLEEVRLIKDLEQKKNLTIKQAVSFRALHELNGKSGRIVLAATYVYNALSQLPKSPAFLKFLAKFNSIFVSIASEAVSYCKSQQSLPYVQGRFASYVDTIKLRTNKRPELVLQSHLIPLVAGKDIEFVTSNFNYNNINKILTHMDVTGLLRPKIQSLIHTNLVIEMYIMKSLDIERTPALTLSHISRCDRSCIIKSSIKPYNSNYDTSIKSVKPKLNGFQYQMSYDIETQTCTVISRYPTAPQIFIYGFFGYSFDLNVEVAKSLDDSFDVRIISVREFQGIIPIDSENDNILSRVSRFFSAKVNCTFDWPYNKPDGIIITKDNGQIVYAKKDATLDLYYDTESEQPTVKTIYYIGDTPVTIPDQWSSEILRHHLSYKPQSYIDSYKKVAIRELEKFKKRKNFHAFGSDSLEPYLRSCYDQPGSYRPAIPKCYSIPIKYTSFDFNTIHYLNEVDINTVKKIYDYYIITTSTSQSSLNQCVTKFSALTCDDFNS